MRIAVDAMGGDLAPREIVRGAVDAVKGLDGIDEITLVGDETAIRAELAAYGAPDLPKLRVLHASQVIGMDESPAQAVRTKKDSSINRGVDLVKQGQADAFVSAGSTGAVVAASIFGLRRLAGVKRPAIGTVFPTMGRPVLLLDAGANTDCEETELEQFAVMGSLYSHAILHQEKPVVGLLSIGGADLKGNDVTKRTLDRLRQNKTLNFRGNVEGHDLFEGHTDVVVCDGFVGNVVLKTTESVSRTIGQWMKQEFKRNPLRIFGALCLSGALKLMKQRMDPELYGGAPLLGVNGTVIITHGASTRKAIFHAIRVGSESVASHVNEKISDQLRRAHEDTQTKAN